MHTHSPPRPPKKQVKSPKRVYGARSVKRIRRANNVIQEHDEILVSIARERSPTTCRHIFYVASNNYKIVPKTEQGYKSICRRLTILRRNGRIPWPWITDNTRWHIKNDSYASLSDALERMQEGYRRNLWLSQEDYVEVWCEKDAIAGILTRATSRFDVPLMVVRGFSSLSFMYGMAQTMIEIDKPTYIYYFGDHDPAGLQISKCIERQLREFAPGVDLHFKRLAVTPDQIVSLDLPTRPTKRNSGLGKTFEGDSVEVDAIDPRILVELASEAIQAHVDADLEQTTANIEQHERDTLRGIVARLQGAPA